MLSIGCILFHIVKELRLATDGPLYFISQGHFQKIWLNNPFIKKTPDHCHIFNVLKKYFLYPTIINNLKYYNYLPKRQTINLQIHKNKIHDHLRARIGIRCLTTTAICMVLFLFCHSL